MSRVLLSTWFALCVLVSSFLPAWAGNPVHEGLDYLSTQQQADGGFTNGFSEGSDLGTTCDVVLAIAAGGQDASTWTSEDGNSPLDYLHARVTADAVDTLGLKAKVTLALLATDQDPAAFAENDLVAELNVAYDDSTGSYGGNIFEQALVILALAGADEPVPAEAIDYLLDKQSDDGAWALFGGSDEIVDTNTTAVVVQALVATGHRAEVGQAFAYLRRVQNDDGGFPYQNPSEYGTDTDANSTAVVLQALMAAGESLDDWTPAGSSPLDALLALYDPEGGGFLWQAAVPGPNVLATAQAIPALAGYTFVKLPRVQAANPPASVARPSDVTLPGSGGVELLPVGVIALAVVALGSGLVLRRHWR